MISRAICFFAVGCFPLVADDWPIYRGPNHDGISKETGWTSKWPASGPKRLWSAKVGIGFSSISVADGRAYTMGNAKDQDTVYCFEAVSGKKLWSHSYNADLGRLYYNGGPSVTPTVDGNRVYTLSRFGDLFCFDAASGKIVWQRNITKEEKLRQGDWGYSGSPFPYGKLLLLNAGPAGLAVDKMTGKTIWKSGEAEPGYSTPYPYKSGGREYFIFSSGEGFAGVEPMSGKRIWFFGWPTRYGVNAADPIVVGDQVFVSSGYSKGAGMFRLKPGEPEELWKDRKFRTQLNTAVLIDGYLYGPDGDSNSKAYFKCLDWKTGKLQWETQELGFASVIASQGKLIVLSPKGDLMVGPASPKGFKAIAKAKVIGGKCWTVPTLANGRIYVRNAAGDLVCIDVSGK